MRLLTFAIALTIAGNVIYHIAQKSIPQDAHPVVSVIASWSVSIAVSLALLPFLPLRGSIAKEVSRLNWASVAVGASIIAVELGFLLAYRSGWNINVGAVTSNTAVGVLLIPTGMLLFNERLSLTHAAGIVFCLIGLVLVTR